MADYLALQELTAAELNDDFNDLDDRLDDAESLITADDVQNAAGTTTSASYTATLTGGTACGIAFSAPPSGKVLILSNCQLSNSGANASLCSIEMRAGAVIGSGAVALAAADDNALNHNGTTSERNGGSVLMEGLTPGGAYNVQQLYRVSAGTGTFSNKSLIVQAVQ